MAFEQFLGNATAVATVRRMLAEESVPSALLFSGPRGVGKLTLALMLAKALNCERAAGDFCGECAACQRVEEMVRLSREDLAHRRELSDAERRTQGLIYFDVQLIEPLTQFILPAQIQEAVAVAYSCPFQLKRRVILINEAQQLHWAGVDKLLKVTEEPPASTTFILVCPNAFQLRATVRSRCSRIAFQPLPEKEITRELARRARGNEADQRLIARLAAGSLARALDFDLNVYKERRRPWLEFLDFCAGKAH